MDTQTRSFAAADNDGSGRRTESQGALSEQWVKMPPVKTSGGQLTGFSRADLAFWLELNPEKEQLHQPTEALRDPTPQQQH